MTSNADRVRHRAEVISVLEAAFADWDTADLLPRLAELGVPAGRVRTLDEVYNWEQTRSQGLLVDVEHASLGPVQLPGPPLRFFAAGQDRPVEVPGASTPPRHCSASTPPPCNGGWTRRTRRTGWTGWTRPGPAVA